MHNKRVRCFDIVTKWGAKKKEYSKRQSQSTSVRDSVLLKEFDGSARIMIIIEKQK